MATTTGAAGGGGSTTAGLGTAFGVHLSPSLVSGPALAFASFNNSSVEGTFSDARGGAAPPRRELPEQAWALF